MSSTKALKDDGVIRYRNEKGLYHRTDGPAYIGTNGYKAWYINGLRHKEDGPAILLSYDDVEYYLNGKKYSEEEYEQEVLKLKLMRLKDL